MQFHQFLLAIVGAVKEEDAQRLGYMLRVSGPNVGDLLRDLHDSRRETLQRHATSVVEPWGEMAVAHVQVVVHSIDGNHVEAYKEQAALVQFFLRYFQSNTGWTLPALYSILRDLRQLGEKADKAVYHATKTISSKWQEDVARICNKAFTNCVIDRTSPRELSRKWGTYYTLGLVLKCYFKVNTTALARNVLRALKANSDIPALEEFPRAHQVTYRYYIGMLSFLNEEYAKAEEELTLAFYHCHSAAVGNLNRTMTYLLPLRILKGHLPSRELLRRFPHLDALYSPFINAIRIGDLRSYDQALYDANMQKRLLDLGLYLVFEKAREICIRGLFRKVWLSTKGSKRIPVELFYAGLRVSGQDVSMEEAECLIAIMIYRGFMKGYISHEKQMVVLAGTSTFPPLGQRAEMFS